MAKLQEMNKPTEQQDWVRNLDERSQREVLEEMTHMLEKVKATAERDYTNCTFPPSILIPGLSVCLRNILSNHTSIRFYLACLFLSCLFAETSY